MLTNVKLAPPMPFIPKAAHGKPALVGCLVDVDPVDQAEWALSPGPSRAAQRNLGATPCVTDASIEPVLPPR